MNLGLDGKACVVTGGSRGIGAATVRMLREEGASVLVVARDPGPDGLALDMTSPDAGERCVAACVARFGAIDVLVNNAGRRRSRLCWS